MVKQVLKHACLCALPALALSSASAGAQITLVQVTQCGPGAFPATVCAVSATGSHNLIVVAWASAEGTAPTIASVTDNAGNIYGEAGNARAVNSTYSMVDIWYAKNSQAGATTVTVTPNPSGNAGAAVVWEFSGVDTLSPLDQTAVLNSQPVTSTPSGAPVTTTAPIEAVVSVVAPQWWLSSLANGNGFISDSLLNQSPYTTGWAHLITSSAGTYAATWNTGLDTYASATVSFKAAGAISACDLNADGSVNILDVQLATDMDLSEMTCTAPGGYCNTVFVQNVLNAALAQACSLIVLGVPSSPVNIGNVIVGGTGLQSATLTATGSGATTISQVTATPATFGVSGLTLPLTLAAGQSAPFNVSFTPIGNGSATGNLTVVTSGSSNGLNSPFNVPLTAYGVNTHTVALSWAPSTSTNVASYNVYRVTSSSTTAPATPYPSLVSNLAATAICSTSTSTCSYTDSAVLAGQSYWYYSTAVDTSNNESAPSNTAQAVVPVP